MAPATALSVEEDAASTGDAAAGGFVGQVEGEGKARDGKEEEDAGECEASGRELAVPTAEQAREMIARVKPWNLAKVPYSQKKYLDGYRTDCSGYLAMFWGLKRDVGLTTRHFFKNSFAGADAILERDPRYTRDRAKFDGVHLADLIPFEQLVPGDGLYKACPKGGSCGHVMLVAGVADNGSLHIYHQTGSSGASKDTLTWVGEGGSKMAQYMPPAGGYTMALRRGEKTVWKARVWPIRRRDAGCDFEGELGQ